MWEGYRLMIESEERSSAGQETLADKVKMN